MTIKTLSFDAEMETTLQTALITYIGNREELLNKVLEDKPSNAALICLYAGQVRLAMLATMAVMNAKVYTPTESYEAFTDTGIQQLDPTVQNLYTKACALSRALLMPSAEEFCDSYINTVRDFNIALYSYKRAHTVPDDDDKTEAAQPTH